MTQSELETVMRRGKMYVRIVTTAAGYVEIVIHENTSPHFAVMCGAGETIMQAMDNLDCFSSTRERIRALLTNGYARF